MRKLILFPISLLFIVTCRSPEHDIVIEIINNGNDTLFFENGFSQSGKIDTTIFFTHNYFENRKAGYILYPDSIEKRYYFSREFPQNKKFFVVFFYEKSIEKIDWKIENFEFLVSKIVIMSFDSLKNNDFKVYYQ
jgi:hypothetical protein